MKKILTAAGGLLLALSVGAGVASAAVSAEELQQMLIDQLTPQLGVAPDSVVCPGALETDLGSAVTCQVSVGSVTHAVTVTVASNDGEGIGLSMEVSG